jgi:ABC-2 type transport system permease protein
MPIIMIILFGFALTTEVRNINIAIFAPKPDNMVMQIIDKLNANEHFTICKYLDKSEDIDCLFKTQKADIIVAFEENFSNNIYSPEGSQMQIIVDAGDANMAQSYMTYTSSIILQYYNELMPQDNSIGITPNVILLYNPQMKSSYNFVPGIMGLILMLICAMMTSIAIVKEKETGTMEVLLVSPIRPIYIILAKMIPYFTLSCINLITILLLSIFVLKVPVAGSIFALALVSLLYIFTTLALGLLVSTVAKQQVIAMLFSAMLLMVPTILLSGMVFPIESMPKILRAISCILPPRWYIAAIRKLMIQGLPITFALKETAILALMAFTLITVSFKKFKNKLE